MLRGKSNIRRQSNLYTLQLPIMSFGAIAEPALVIFLLFGGTYLNRTWSNESSVSAYTEIKHDELMGRAEKGAVGPVVDDDGWRHRKIGLSGWRCNVRTPDTQIFQDRFLSRILRRFPFLLEVLYWALIYWV